MKPRSTQRAPSQRLQARGWLAALRLPHGLVIAVTAAAYLAIAAASLVPKALRPTSGVLPGPVEHFAAYFVLGFIAAFALRERMGLWRLAALNAVYAGCLEIAQIAVPGRVSTPVDFTASALGSCLGIAVFALLMRKPRAGT